MPSDEITTVTSRLDRLERAHRRLRLAALVLGALLLVTWARRAELDVMRVHRLQLVDQEDRVRAELRHDSTETGLFILDHEGTIRVGAAHFAHGGSGVALHGPGLEGAAVLYLKGRGSLTFYDSAGGVRGQLAESQP